MIFILDTSVAIHLRDGDPETTRRLRALDGALVLSVLTRVELEGDIVSDPAHAARRRPLLDAMLAGMETLAFDAVAADSYRAIVEAAGFSRRKVIDRMIAAQALAHAGTLVTRNPADFQDIPGLQLLSW